MSIRRCVGSNALTLSTAKNDMGAYIAYIDSLCSRAKVKDENEVEDEEEGDKRTRD